MKHSPIRIYCDHHKCPAPANIEYTPTQFSRWIEETDDLVCDGCGKELYVENLKLSCYICDADIEFFDLESAKNDVR